MNEPPTGEQLRQVLVSLKLRAATLNDAQRIVGKYCRERHRQGALAETVLVEIKGIAVPILYDDYAKIEKLVTKCVRDYFDTRTGDVAT